MKGFMVAFLETSYNRLSSETIPILAAHPQMNIMNLSFFFEPTASDKGLLVESIKVNHI